MTFFRALRTLVFGETWVLPVGVVVGACAVAGSLLDEAWHHLGGFALLAGTLIVLILSVALSARQRP